MVHVPLLCNVYWQAMASLKLPISVLKLAQHSVLTWAQHSVLTCAPLTMAYGVFWGSDLYIRALFSVVHIAHSRGNHGLTEEQHILFSRGQETRISFLGTGVGGWKILRQSLAMWPRLALNPQHFSCLILPGAERHRATWTTMASRTSYILGRRQIPYICSKEGEAK